MKTDDGDQGELFKKLDAITRLLSLLLMKGSTRREQIESLAAAKLPPREIAELLGTTPNAVSVELNRIRASARKRPSKQVRPTSS